MNKRLFISSVMLVVCVCLMAQAKIVSITYDGDEAILTRNTPPAGVVYYWQGTSCGTLMNHSGSSTLATNSGTYYLHEYNSTGAIWATSCASTIVLFPDLISPVLSGVTTGPIEEGDHIAATSNEDGMIFLNPAGTSADYATIVSSRVASATATASVAVSLSTAGNGMGDFIVFAADEAHNVSTASAVITVTDLTSPVLSGVTSGQIGEGEDIAATSNENGMIYLVPAGTAANVGAIGAVKVAEATATASVAVSLSTTGIDLGDYILYAVDGFDNVSTASTIITLADLTAPVLSGVTAGPIEVGTDIAATSNEDGVIYLVPDGTAANTGAIGTAKVAEAMATANVAVSLVTTGVSPGDYIVYAVDLADNISIASSVLSINEATSINLNDANSALVELYPVNVLDILHIRSEIQVSSATVYSLLGARLIHVPIPCEQIDMSGLGAGIYFVRIQLADKSVFSGKVTKR